MNARVQNMHGERRRKNHDIASWQTKNGGPLEIEHVVFSEGRGNVLLKYPGHTTSLH